MNRRGFLRGCGCCAALFPTFALPQSWQSPARFSRPETSSEEGGLWALMDREETRLRRSAFIIRDAQLQRYVQDIACRLGGQHCPDVRVHLVRTPMFNASMAPNGMIQVWSGLLLRVENEAQLAAVLGHEIGHYLERHSLEKLRDVRSRSAFAQVLGLFGLVGAIGQLATMAGMLAHSRDQERVADRIGVALMHGAGYDATEAAKIWENLLLELKAGPEGDPTRRSPLFASHPPADERRETLLQLAEAAPGGDKRENTWLERIRPHRLEWLTDEVKRAQHDESLALMTRMLAGRPEQPDVLFARGEVYRMRAREGDGELAIADYRGAAALGNEPPETHRGLGLVHRSRKQWTEARASFERYLQLAPNAPDAPMIKSYVEESGT